MKIIRLFSIIIVLFFSISCENNNETLRKDSAVRFKKTEQGKEVIGELIDIQFARTDEERANGLMYKKSIPNKFGMFFVFNQDEPRSFWMKNTYISLDMVFISKDGIVKKVIENTVPLSSTSRVCEEPVSYVLELNSGTSKGLKAEVGSVIEFIGQKP